MKVSLSAIRFLNQHYGSAGDPAPDGTTALVEKIGAQLGAVEGVDEFGKRFEGIVIVKVVTCEDHPDADRLHVCTIDDAGTISDVKRDASGYVQVVCGAPNVRAGMLAAWLPPDSTVPSSYDKEPFVLEAREIRGQVSNGMLASPKELGLSDNHEGILEVALDSDEQIVPGTTFVDAYHLKDDVIIDIENKMFTHRPDCFGYLGIARELEGIQGRPYKSPDWYTPKPAFPAVETDELKLEFHNELPELVPRFTLVVVADVAVKPSPVWLQVDLARAGLRPINNIVDYTNFFMLETGQPLHAYDYDKVKALSGGDGATIVVRNPKPGEKVKLLNGKEIEPRGEAITIATDKQLIGLGGVMGGSETEVDNDTKNIILESGNFGMYSIRRTSMAHGLFTDAVTRFNKGQSPLQNLAVLARITDEIRQFAGGKVAGPVIDDNHLDQSVMQRQSLYVPVKVTAEFINARLGLKLGADEMKQLLTNVEFGVEVNSDELTITAPFWRTDIELREDIVEEVGRLYGFDKLPLALPLRDLTPAPKDQLLELKANVRARLAKAGANEVLTYSFVHGNLLDKTGQDKARAFELGNALSPDLQYYRMSLMPSLLDKVHANIKSGYDEFALFELGKTHSLDHSTDDEGLPREFEFTALVVAANDKLRKTGAAYYQARTFLDSLCGIELEFKPVGDDMLQYAVVQPYDVKRSALVTIKGGDFLGIIGEFKSSVARQLKLPAYCAGFEIDTSVLSQALDGRKEYVALPRFPKVTQDITLKVATDVPYQELRDFLSHELEAARPENSRYSLSPVSIYQRQDDETHKQLTFRLMIASYAKTMTDSEVNALLDTVAAAAASTYSAERV